MGQVPYGQAEGALSGDSAVGCVRQVDSGLQRDGVHSADRLFYGARMKPRCALRITLAALVLVTSGACGSRANRSETVQATSQRSTTEMQPSDVAPQIETEPSDVAEPAELNPAPQPVLEASTTTNPTGTCDMQVLSDEGVAAATRRGQNPRNEVVDPANTPTRPRLEVHGSLSREVVRRIIRRHDKEVRLCFERLRPEERPTAQVTMHFRITPEGQVADVKLLLLASPSSELPCCIADAMGTWTFPPPEGGGVVLVTNPFTAN